METIKDLLEKRKNYLTILKEEKERALKDVPEGFLRINNHKGNIQYYQRTNPKDFSGEYISKKDIEIAQRLAQKDYDKKILQSIEQELKAIKAYTTGYPKLNAEQVYESLHREKQKLVYPIRKTEEQYVESWEKVVYRGKSFEGKVPEMYTAKGERVRSKSEIIIADSLGREGIPYRYECPLRLKGWGEVFPDFTVLNVGKRKEMYWEHLGRMDDADYVEKALRKLKLYEQHGIFQGDKLILTYETSKNPMNQKDIKRIIKHFLK